MPADRDLAVALQTTRVILEASVDRPARAVARLAASFATATADGCHVFTIAAHCDAALAAGFTRLTGIEFVRGSLGMSGFAALAGDLTLFASIHGREAAIASGSA